MTSPHDDPPERDRARDPHLDDAIDLGLGGAAGDDRRRLRDVAARDQGLAALAATFEERLSPLLLDAPEVAPAPDLFDRIEARLDRAGGAETVRLDDGAWSELAPGVLMKTLWRPGIVMLRCARGARIPAHPHPVWERMIVLSGDVVIDGETFESGDYHAAPPGGAHPDITTRAGCLIVLHYEA